jgi:hypothetical protein
MEILLFIAFAVVNALCFKFGAKVGQAMVKGGKVEKPKNSTLKAFKDRGEKERAEMEREKFETIMRNVERYDGTGRGQEDVGG